MADLNLEKLSRNLEALVNTLRIHQVQALFANRTDMAGHVKALSRLAQGDREARTAAFAELATVYADQERHDFSCLLSYRAMESLVETGLKTVCPDLDIQAPNWSLLKPEEELKEELSKLDGRCVVHLPPFIGFELGFRLLCVMDNIHERFVTNPDVPEDRRLDCALKTILKLAKRRNESILAHGSRTLEKEDSDVMLAGFKALAAAIYHDRLDAFNNLLEDLRRRPLGDFVTLDYQR